MLERLAAYVLNKYIGQYVENFNSQNLSIGIVQGICFLIIILTYIASNCKLLFIHCCSNTVFLKLFSATQNR